MAAKGVQMHGLENVDKTDDPTDVTPPPTPVVGPVPGPTEVPAPPPAPAPRPTATEASADTLPSPSTPLPTGGPGRSSTPPSAPRARPETPKAAYVAPVVSAPHLQPEARRSVTIVPPTDFREHKYRVPRTFRFDVDLLEYIERHEKYRAALEDPRTFTEKVNDWVRSQMNEENPVLLQAEADVVGLRSGRRSQETDETSGDDPSPVPEPSLTAPTIPSPPVPDHATSTLVTPAAASASSPKKGPSIWELEKQVKTAKARETSGSL